MANESTANLWPVGMPSVCLAIAFFAQDQGGVRRAIDVLQRDGLTLSVELAAIGEITFDRLRRTPDLVLIDACGAEWNAVDAVGQVQRRLPGVGTVVIFSEYGETGLRRLLAAGADGLVARSEITTTLPAVVRAVAASHLSVPVRLRHLIQPPALSHREKQVLGLMVAGLTNAQIASRLYLAESTVKTHVTSAFRRLGVKSRREAAARVLAGDPALRQGVLAALEPVRARGRARTGARGLLNEQR